MNTKTAGGRPGMDRKWSADEINRLPMRGYDGPVHVIRAPEDWEACRAGLLAERVLGFDTETRPSFHKGESHPVALLQLAGGQAVYIFQLRHVGLLEEVANLLADPAVVKAGVALGRDLQELRVLREFRPAGLVDLGLAAQRAGLLHHGLRGLCAVLLGFRITKGAQRSNWARADLAPQQVRYAATDAWVSRELYLRMQAGGLLRAAARPPAAAPGTARSSVARGHP